MRARVPQHAERVDALRTLKPREREALYLHGLGHSAHEIADLTASSYTAVNRRLSEGRAALRRGGRAPRRQVRPPRAETSAAERNQALRSAPHR